MGAHRGRPAASLKTSTESRRVHAEARSHRRKGLATEASPIRNQRLLLREDPQPGATKVLLVGHRSQVDRVHATAMQAARCAARTGLRVVTEMVQEEPSLDRPDQEFVCPPMRLGLEGRSGSTVSERSVTARVNGACPRPARVERCTLGDLRPEPRLYVANDARGAAAQRVTMPFQAVSMGGTEPLARHLAPTVGDCARRYLRPRRSDACRVAILAPPCPMRLAPATPLRRAFAPCHGAHGANGCWGQIERVAVLTPARPVGAAPPSGPEFPIASLDGASLLRHNRILPGELT